MSGQVAEVFPSDGVGDFVGIRDVSEIIPVAATFGTASSAPSVDDATQPVDSLGYGLSGDASQDCGFRCVTEHVKSNQILSARAGFMLEHNGRRLLPRWKLGSVVTYVVLEESFPSKNHANFARRALAEAADDWNSRHVGVRFQSVEHGEHAVFALKYYRAPRRFFAESFFPNSKDRIMYIFRFSFRKEYQRSMANVFRHELGHVLGLRHEEAGASEFAVPSVELAPQNGLSIMSDFTDPGTVSIQESDVAAVKKLVTIDAGIFDGFEVVTVDPDNLDQLSFNDSDRLSSRGSDLVSTRTEGSDNGQEEEEPCAATETREAEDLKEPEPAQPARRGRAPTITIDTSTTEQRSSVDGESAQRASYEDAAPSYLSVRNAIRSDTTFLSVPKPSVLQGNSNDRDTKQADHFNMLDLDLQDALTPDPGTEDMFLVEDNPFAFSPGQLYKMIYPNSHSAFYALGGLSGLEKGLRTNRDAGLSVDEATLCGHVSFYEAATQDASRFGELGEKAPKSMKTTKSMASIASQYHNNGPKPWVGVFPWGMRTRRESPLGFVDRKRVFQTNTIPQNKPKSLASFAWDCFYHSWVLILLTVVAVITFAWDMRHALVALSRGTEDTWAMGWAEEVAVLVCIVAIVASGASYRCKSSILWDRSVESKLCGC